MSEVWDYAGKSPFKLLVLSTGRKGLNGIKVSLSLNYQLLFRKWAYAPTPDSTWKSNLSYSASSQVGFRSAHTVITTIFWIVFAIPLYIMPVRNLQHCTAPQNCFKIAVHLNYSCSAASLKLQRDAKALCSLWRLFEALGSGFAAQLPTFKRCEVAPVMLQFSWGQSDFLERQ